MSNQLIKLVNGVAINIEFVTQGIIVTQLVQTHPSCPWNVMKKVVYQEPFVLIHDLADALGQNELVDDEYGQEKK